MAIKFNYIERVISKEEQNVMRTFQILKMHYINSELKVPTTAYKVGFCSLQNVNNL